MGDSVGNQVVGHGECQRCAALVPLAILMRSGRLCEKCLELGAAPTPITEVRVGGRNVTLTHPSFQRSGSKGSRASRSLVKAAHKAAAKRLRDSLPEIYRLFYIEERARRGLDPVPLQNTPPLDEGELRAELAAVESADMEAVYAALANEGIEL
jgi:hypothetical protein